MFGKALQTLLKAHALHALAEADTAFAIEVLRKLPSRWSGELAVRSDPLAHGFRAVPRMDWRVPEFLNIGCLHRRPPRHAGAERVAMIVEDDALGTSAITYRELAERTSRFAQLLRSMGVAAATACSCGLPNSIDYPPPSSAHEARRDRGARPRRCSPPRRCATC
jgi:hypothetical protein